MKKFKQHWFTLITQFSPTDKYTIDDQVLFIRNTRWFWRSTTDSLPLNKIENVNIEKVPMGKLLSFVLMMVLGYRRVIISTGDDKFILKYVMKPQQFRDALLKS